MLLTLNLEIDNLKAQAFLDFIKTLDFVKIKEKDDSSDFVLTNEHISLLDERKQNHINNMSKSYSWNEIQDELRNSAI